MNIYKYEFRKYLKGTIIWSFSIIAVLFFYLALFPTFSAEAGQFEKLMQQFPEAFRKAMGLNDMNLANIQGFYSFTFSYIVLIGGIFAMKLGVDITSKETREKTSDFLLVKPLKRVGILTPKYISAFTHIIIMNVIYIPSSFIAIELFKNGNYNSNSLFLLTFSMFFIQVFLFALGALIGAAAKKLKNVLPITLGIVFGFYVLHLFNQTIEDEKYSYLTPFGFFDSGYITENAAYSRSHFWVCIIFSIIFIILSYAIYQRKDIPSV
ncbi:MAG: ABC transporter permease [Vallitalea sp.]|jgi:ABC-2 type transport system permease protein|nr:ABC transporter permease [Vallitalea sp.]